VAASSSSIAIKGEDSLTQSQKWPVGFGPSREVVAQEQGDELWDGEDDDFPLPLGFFPPDWAVDWELEVMRAWTRPWRFWMPLKRTSIGELRPRAQSPRVGGKF